MVGGGVLTETPADGERGATSSLLIIGHERPGYVCVRERAYSLSSKTCTGREPTAGQIAGAGQGGASATALPEHQRELHGGGGGGGGD